MTSCTLSIAFDQNQCSGNTDVKPDGPCHAELCMQAHGGLCFIKLLKRIYIGLKVYWHIDVRSMGQRKCSWYADGICLCCIGELSFLVSSFNEQ